jgi:preprotein translocase subunit SecB
MTEPTSNDQAAAAGNTNTGQFAIQKIYIKDISFETPHSPQIFAEEWAPRVNMQLSSEASGIQDDLTEVVLTVTLTVTIGEKTAYLVEAHIAGIFLIKDIPAKMVEQMAATICPNILFPFARELVCDLVTRGGFPQLLLAPVNFEALYAQQKKQNAMDAEDKSADAETKH